MTLSDFVASSGWKLAVDIAQIVGAAGTFVVAAVALYLSAKEVEKAKRKELRDLVEVFWGPAAEACGSIANWNLAKDASAISEHLELGSARLRQALQKAVRVLPEHSKEVMELRILVGEVATANQFLPESLRTAGKTMEVVAQRFFEEPGRLEKPTIQWQNRFGEWEDVSVWRLLNFWFSRMESSWLPGIASMRLQYAARISTSAPPYLQELWKTWEGDSILRTAREKLGELSRASAKLESSCEEIASKI